MAPSSPAAQTPRIQLAASDLQAKIIASSALTDQTIKRLHDHAIVKVSSEPLMAPAGATAHYETRPSERYFRDMETLWNHAVLDADNHLELYGRMLMSEDSGSAFL